MNNISIKNIIEITGGHLIGDLTLELEEAVLGMPITNIVTDSRKVKNDSLFVAIPGNVTDGHAYIYQVAKIAKAALVEIDIDAIRTLSKDKNLTAEFACIKVDNTIEALQQIGKYFRNIYAGRVIGVTGSVGKTTTREMMATVLASNVPTYSTKENQNSQIGVPITLSDMLDDPSDVAVIEMGISEPGEMDKLVEMVNPDVAVVTIIGDSHIEHMGSREGIRDEKLKIISKMNEDGVLFINADDPLLYEIKDKAKVRTIAYGIDSEADYRAEDISFVDGMSHYTFVHGNERRKVKLNVLGKHNILNSLVALAICDYMNLDLNNATKSLATFKGMRQNVISTDAGYTIIDDTYNASPDSMKAALNVLRDMDIEGDRVAVLGDMYELGENSPLYHKLVGEYINELKLNDGTLAVDKLITIGKDSKYIDGAVQEKEIETRHFNDKDEAVQYIDSKIRPGDAILFKASNGMKLKELVDRYIKRG